MKLLKKTIYLRESDEALWAECPNKSLLVHNALEAVPWRVTSETVVLGDRKEGLSDASATSKQ